MKILKWLLLPLIVTGGQLLAAEAASHSNTPFDPWEKRLNADGLLELEWDDLVPADFDPDKLFAKLAKKYNITELDDNDPRAKEFQAEMRNIMNHAPVVESLNGRQVRMPGLVIPLEGDGVRMSEFLLVPYFGACIHVPPPPSNQIVYVRTGAQKAAIREFYEAVWVTGILITEHSNSEVGVSSYTINADKVAPYE